MRAIFRKYMGKKPTDTCKMPNLSTAIKEELAA